MHLTSRRAGRMAINRAFIHFAWIFLLLSWPPILKGQKGDVFTVHGKEIRIREFDTEMEKMMDDLGVPGASLAVIDKDRIVYFNAYGYKRWKHAERVTKRTVFEACSLSKNLLVFVAHQLADEGRLDLDKPMVQYLKYPLLEHDQRYKMITPRMILSHCSGIENWMANNNPDTLDIVSNPGEKFVYSGEGYNYLALAIGKILNQTYEQYMKERVIKPMKLKDTYLKFEQHGSLLHKASPSDYAIGHGTFWEEQGKWKNTDPVPAAGCNITAGDYAKLILSFFDKKHLSDGRIRDITRPVVKMNPNDTTLYFGPGFAIIFRKGDTLISQFGSNPGFKANFYYSVVNKCGFVFFSNSDNGALMTQKISGMTAGFDINYLFAEDENKQYPSPAIDLLKIYREEGTSALLAEVDKQVEGKKIGAATLNELAGKFMTRDRAIARGLLMKSIQFGPDPRVYQLLGRIYVSIQQYDSARRFFGKAKAMKADLPDVDEDLADCARQRQETERRKILLVRIGETANTRLPAENFNSMYGVEIGGSSDSGHRCVGYTDPGDWMDYQADIVTAGTYSLGFRVSSLPGGGRIELRSGDKVLTSVAIGSTKGWENWTTVGVDNVYLPAGNQTLKLYIVSGGFNLNWLEFHRMSDNAKKD